MDLGQLLRPCQPQIPSPDGRPWQAVPGIAGMTKRAQNRLRMAGSS
jgi:hypothetical protein